MDKTVADWLDVVREHFLKSDFRGAVSACNALLRIQPHHTEALESLACCELELGYPQDAVLHLLAAMRNRALDSMPPEEARALWSRLHIMFNYALCGIDGRHLASQRSAYHQWCNSAVVTATSAQPLVSVVLIVPQHAPWPQLALDSILAQTYRHIELVVVHGNGAYKQGIPASDALAKGLSSCPFPWRLLLRPNAHEAAMINAGVEASRGEFINVLHANHLFLPNRLALFVEQVAIRGRAWGFAKTQFGLTAGYSRDVEPRASLWHQLQEALPNGETTGHALLASEFVAVAESNLFFSKGLYSELGGFRSLPNCFAWDFALRAVWHHEPVFIASIAYQHRLLPRNPELSDEKRYTEYTARVAMFQQFYQLAMDERHTPNNPFAPCIKNWRLHCLRAVLGAGHIRYFSLDALKDFGAAIKYWYDEKSVAELTPGINLIGFAYGNLGLGQSLRGLAQACIDGNIPFAVRDIDPSRKAQQKDQSIAAHVVDELRHRVSVYCAHPDMRRIVGRFFDSQRLLGGYAIGYWYWELDTIPDEWLEFVANADEIWVATDFVAEAFRRATNKPVIKIAPPLEVTLSRTWQRAEYGLPDDRFLFMFSFDFNSFVTRKNPQAAIRAFKQAFPSHRRDVGLVVKTTNASGQPGQRGEILKLIADDNRIVMLDRAMNRDEFIGLHSVIDAYVSLHRSEGLGLGLAEAMYLGKPVIGTAYSGNLDFMNQTNSCLVDYQLIPVKLGEYLYHDERFRWANPDEAHAAAYMERLVDDVAYREQIARQGKQDVRSRFTTTNTAALMRARLTKIGML